MRKFLDICFNWGEAGPFAMVWLVGAIICILILVFSN
jgi:hypothetical protein